MIDHGKIDNLDRLTPMERAALLCPEIRAMGGDNGLVDAIFGDGDQWLADLIAEYTEHLGGLLQHPDSAVYEKLVSKAYNRISNALISRVVNVAEESVNARLMQQYEDAQEGRTVEQEDLLSRARDLIAEAHR